MPQKLLLADDSVTIQRVIELTFADEDVQVLAVGDGRQAIDRITAERPDIVLADVGMPGCDGYEVCSFVKQTPELAHIPVLLLTGAFEPVDDVPRDGGAVRRRSGEAFRAPATHREGQSPAERAWAGVEPPPRRRRRCSTPRCRPRSAQVQASPTSSERRRQPSPAATRRLRTSICWRRSPRATAPHSTIISTGSTRPSPTWLPARPRPLRRWLMRPFRLPHRRCAVGRGRNEGGQRPGQACRDAARGRGGRQAVSDRTSADRAGGGRTGRDRDRDTVAASGRAAAVQRPARGRARGGLDG